MLPSRPARPDFAERDNPDGPVAVLRSKGYEVASPE